MSSIILLLNIVHGSIWGVLARIGIGKLTTYNQSYLSGVVWANFVACLIISLCINNSKIWSNFNGTKNPVYVGISTGFCGTLSSFSSFILELFYKTTNSDITYYHYPNSRYGILEFITIILVQLALSIFGFILGKHNLGIPTIQSQKFNKTLELFSAFLGISLVIIAAFLIGFQLSWRSWMFACIFAPFGALLRFFLSKLNPKIKDFPIGTFIANILGSILIAVFSLLLRSKLGTHSLITTSVSCHVIIGLIDGFSGGLTTVSTFVTELFNLSSRSAYRYCIVSIVLCFILVLVILGPYHWTRGFTSPVCQ